MNYKIGDLVRFVDEPIEGHITSLQAHDMVGVTDETGFEIPVLKSKITLVHGNMRMPEDEIDPVHSSSDRPFQDKGIFLGVAGEQKDGLAKFYILNETSYELLVSISEIVGTKTAGTYANLIPRFDYAQVYTTNFAHVNKWPTFQIQIVRHTTAQQKRTEPLSKEIRVKPLDLIISKEKTDLLDDKVWLFELDKIEENIGIDKLQSHFVSHRPNKR